MSNRYQRVEDLVIWQDSMSTCQAIYRILGKCKDWGLRDQMQRAAVSVPSNIAEGFELNSNKAFIRHLYIAKGSAVELRTQLYIAYDLGYIHKEEFLRLLDTLNKMAAQIQRFIVARSALAREPG
jgi:four helix bundle protein